MASASQAVQAFKPSLGYIDFIKKNLDISFIAFINCDEEVVIDNVKYSFKKGQKGIWSMPFGLLWNLRKERPDVIFVQGLCSPAQVICTRILLKKDTVIIVQHHGDQPPQNGRAFMQKMADKFIDAYLFTAAGNAVPWIKRKLISSQEKCFEVLEASTYLKKQDRRESREMLGITGGTNFLWVGRLEQNKDPVTVLYGFEKYLCRNPEARLYMIYQEDVLLQEIKAIIYTSEVLKNAVLLVGKVANEKLASWYSAMDFYISGSHREGSGYALIEAMACGCIPVITNIPSFRKITGNGKFGYLYTPGDTQSLFETLMALPETGRENISESILDYFNISLSFEAIADDIFKICCGLVK